MDFPTAIKTSLRKLTVFSGRASRSEYWWWFLFVHIALYALSYIVHLLLIFNSFSMVILVFLGYWLLFLFSLIAVSVRRVHDANYVSLFAIFLFLMLPVAIAIGIGVDMSFPCHGMGCFGRGFIGGALGMSLWVLVVPLWIGLLKGTPGPNRFGPDPRA
jgi:uncharacterized membrane protein YhaH (DUF805 family)